MAKSNSNTVDKVFCCEKMGFAINKEHIIDYDDCVRNYNLCGDKRDYAILYCPWCGKDLGKRLNWEYFEILAKEYGIEDPDFVNFTNVPEEFKTDAWWKKRGL
ncbi:MAG: hypothetical protein KBC27_00220 [Rickettsiales bacterium]|nr:hypothetical protein [Rickettsiales bacterium]